jgi:hypothetical protein
MAPEPRDMKLLSRSLASMAPYGAKVYKVGKLEKMG